MGVSSSKPRTVAVVSPEPQEEAQQQQQATPAEEEIDVVEVVERLPELLVDNPDAKPSDRLTARNKLLLVEMLFLALAVMYVEMCLVPVLPTIMRQWPQHSDWVPWILSAYNIVGGVWTPIAGSLVDIFGARPVAMGIMIAYLAGQLGCALAPNIFVLIVCRALQGFGMCIFVICFAVIKQTFPPRLVPVAIGSVSAMFSFGMICGLVGGAATMEALSRWQDIFWTTMPVIALVVILFGFTLPGRMETASKRRVDWIGAIVLAVGVILLLVGLTLSETWGWTHGGTLSMIIIGVVLIVVFCFVELKVPDPLVSIKLMSQKRLIFTNILAFMVGLSLFGMFQALPYMIMSPITNILPEGKKTILNESLVMLPFGPTQLIVAPLASLLGKKTGFSLWTTIGVAFCALATGLLIPWHNTLAQVVCILIILSAGMAAIQATMVNLISECTSKEQFGSASGTNTLFRIIGGSIGPILISLIMNKNPLSIPVPVGVESSDGSVIYTYYETPSDTGYRNVFIFTTVLTAVTWFIMWGFWPDQARFCLEKKQAKQKTSPAPSPPNEEQQQP